MGADQSNYKSLLEVINSGHTYPVVQNIVYLACAVARDSILVAKCNTLCTSGFVDDVKFAGIGHT